MRNNKACKVASRPATTPWGTQQPSAPKQLVATICSTKFHEKSLYDLIDQFSGCSAPSAGIKPRVGTQAVTKEDTVENMEKTQRDHMNNRLYSVLGNRDRDYRKQFNMNDDERPANAEEAVERIKAGQYMIRKKDTDFDDDDDEFDYEGAFNRIYWRDPSKVKDQAGYKAAVDALNKEFENVTDTVKLAPYADAVAAFEAFKKSTVH